MANFSSFLPFPFSQPITVSSFFLLHFIHLFISASIPNHFLLSYHVIPFPLLARPVRVFSSSFSPCFSISLFPSSFPSLPSSVSLPERYQRPPSRLGNFGQVNRRTRCIKHLQCISGTRWRLYVPCVNISSLILIFVTASSRVIFMLLLYLFLIFLSICSSPRSLLLRFLLFMTGFFASPFFPFLFDLLLVLRAFTFSSYALLHPAENSFVGQLKLSLWGGV